jgi:hypothetical protein
MNTCTRYMTRTAMTKVMMRTVKQGCEKTPGRTCTFNHLNLIVPLNMVPAGPGSCQYSCDSWPNTAQSCSHGWSPIKNGLEPAKHMTSHFPHTLLTHENVTQLKRHKKTENRDGYLIKVSWDCRQQQQFISGNNGMTSCESMLLAQLWMAVLW